MRGWPRPCRGARRAGRYARRWRTASASGSATQIRLVACGIVSQVTMPRAPPMCVAIHAVFADALHDALLEAGARGIVTCNTIDHTTNRICIADQLAEAVRERLG